MFSFKNMAIFNDFTCTRHYNRCKWRRRHVRHTRHWHLKGWWINKLHERFPQYKLTKITCAVSRISWKYPNTLARWTHRVPGTKLQECIFYGAPYRLFSYLKIILSQLFLIKHMNDLLYTIIFLSKLMLSLKRFQNCDK